MKILWFPRLQFDIDKFHITTWREMCKELKHLDNDVRIAIGGPYDKDVFDKDYIPVPIIRVKFLRILSFWICGFFQFIIQYLIFKPDLVILNQLTTWFSLPLIFLPKRWRALIVVDSRSPLYNQYVAKPGLRDVVFKIYTRLSYLYCKHCLDGITVITSYYRKKICQDLKIAPSFVGVWTSGVDVARFSPDKYVGNVRPSFLEGKFVVMQHGQLSYNRGLIETVKALAKMEGVCLVLVGGVIKNDTVEDEILKLSKLFHLEERVYIIPPVPHEDIPRYISYCDCAIMAYPDIDYWNYNNPIKLLEYLAMGKVVIATDMWTFREVLGDKRCGYYIKENSPECIVDAIKYCFNNRGLLQEWGKEGIDIANERYTWRKQAKNLLDFAAMVKSKR